MKADRITLKAPVALFAAAATLCLLTLTAFAAPGLAAGPGGGYADTGHTGGAYAPSAYALQGDVMNTTGSTWTGFRSNFADSTGAWDFGTYSNSASVVALTGQCLGSTSTSCVGVYGRGKGTAGVAGSSSGGGAGVMGISNDTFASGSAVYATNSATGDYAYGVSGSAQSSTGANSAGVKGWGSNAGSGVVGTSGGGIGVWGTSSSGTGLYGTSGSGVALFGVSTSGSGFYGFSTNGPGGVMGSQTTEGARFYTRSSSSYALVTGGLSGTYGNAYITGRVTATGGCCSAFGSTSGDRQMYANEATQSIFSDEGTAKLVNGHAVITIDPLFAQSVDLAAGYRVFVTPNSLKTLGLGVVNQTTTSFEVGELNGGSGSFTFHWRVDAIRNGYESVRMAPAAPAPGTLPDSLQNVKYPTSAQDEPGTVPSK